MAGRKQLGEFGGCWFCGGRIVDPGKPWQTFCSPQHRERWHWWNDGWQRRYGVKINLWELLEEQQLQCALCAGDLLDSWEIDHIVPLAAGGETTPDNLQALCRACNKGKWTLTTEDYIAHCERVVAHARKGKVARGQMHLTLLDPPKQSVLAL